MTLPPAPPSAIGPADLDWTADGAPRSQRFDDVYFSREDGLEESRAVFVRGCGLPEAWAGRRRFTVGETGFGTGLNILALLQLWRACGPPGGRLRIFSVEAYPMSRDEAARALSAWPELSELAEPLIARWPRRAPGFHRIDWPELGATLDLAIGDAAWALEAWDGRADAWFLDGFAPARNPQMWRPEVMSALAGRSAAGARLGTFTVAGAVRRGLQDAGFQVDKRPGHGRKRERLEARWPGAPPPEGPGPSVAIIGAGIAGAALVRAFRAEGLDPTVIEAEAAGAGASGNPAALVTPGLDAGGGVRAALYAQVLARAADLYDSVDGAVIGRSAEQKTRQERDGPRFDAILAGGLFEAGALERTEGGLLMRDARCIRPRVVLDAWLAGAPRIRGRAARIEAREGGWRVLGPGGERLADADIVCIAAGAGAPDLAGPPVEPVRGQASWAEGLTLPRPCAWGGYALPMDGALLFGATHDRGRSDTAVLDEDHRRNLQTLAAAFPDLAERASQGPLHGRAAIRAATADRMPAAGRLSAGLFYLGGLGSRGFAAAPLLAEHVAAQALGAPSPLPLHLQPSVDPRRLEKSAPAPTAC